MQKWGGRKFDSIEHLCWKAEEDNVSWNQTMKTFGSWGVEGGVNILVEMGDESGMQSVRTSSFPLASV